MSKSSREILTNVFHAFLSWYLKTYLSTCVYLYYLSIAELHLLQILEHEAVYYYDDVKNYYLVYLDFLAM